MPSGRRSFDVVIASDFRFPGGTTASLAQEIRAQAEAGYRTALLQLASPLLRHPRPIAARIQRCVHEGLAELVRADEPLHARLLVMRHPSAFETRPPAPLDVTSDHKVMVVNQAPQDDSQEAPSYDLSRVAVTVEELFGPGTVWVPIGPLVRDSLAEHGAGLDVLSWDWHNVIDPDEWGGARAGLVGDRPVIGRHSRPKPHKWPQTPGTLLAAYPDDPRVEVQVLGGADHPRELLGRLPDNWTVRGFNEKSPAEFLAGIDFFVYYHHPGLNEAFGRATLEALAAGAVAILPPHFERLFGDAAVYREPSEVLDTVLDLSGDPDRYRAQSARGVAWVRERCGLPSHAARIASFIGEADTAAPRRRSTRARPAPRVLYVTSNGGGLGHLTRTMAMARRASDGVRPMFLTLSTSYGLVQEQGFPVEYAPSRDYSDLPGRRWNVVFADRLRRALTAYEPSALVFDGTHPYAALGEVRDAFPHLPLVWSRRGMWREGLGHDHIWRVEYFDHVIEPGDLCGDLDRGLTATQPDPVPRDRVDPITLLDPDELLSREEAALDLGLDPAQPTALVDLTDPDPERLAATLDRVIGRLLDVEGMQVVAPSGRTSTRARLNDPRIATPDVYPLSRCFAAIDLAVSATGYNTFHELVRFGVPAVFIPKPETPLDDQEARALCAERRGFGRGLTHFTPDGFDEALTDLLDGATRDRMAEAGQRLDPGNGAPEAAAVVERLAFAGRPTATTTTSTRR